MKRITKTIMFIVASAVMAISAAPVSAFACQVDEFYHTKDGVLAASTPEILTSAIKFGEEGNKEKLADLITNGTILRLTGNIKVQVLERSFEYKTLKIKLPEGTATYWVKDGSLKQIDCKENLR
jgi:hypothetical protein